MSKATKWVLDILKEEFPEIYGGGYNCRGIGGRSVHTSPSQHAWPNALDLTNKNFGYSTHPDNQAFLDEVVAFLWDNRVELSIKRILWRGKSWFTGNTVSGHQNHIHVDFWPTGYPSPPCAGGSLRYRYSNGRIINGDPGPENGMNETNDPRPTPPPDSTDSHSMPTLRFWDGYKSKDRGHLGDAVAILQKGLERAGHADEMTSNLTCAADGWFGDGTDAAVRSFQRAEGLTIDGVAGAASWDVLGPVITLKLWDGYTKGRPDLKDTVAMMQMGLARKGFADQASKDGTCAADGWFGEGTETALKAFQSAHGLVADGVCGRLSWSALSAG